MPRCKSCGTVYSSICECCPKCSCPTDEEAYEHETDKNREKTERFDYRSWIWLVIGIFAFIGVMFLVFSLLSLI